MASGRLGHAAHRGRPSRRAARPSDQSPSSATPTWVMNASWKWPGKTWSVSTAASRNGVRRVPRPATTSQASPQAQGIQLPVVYPHWCGRWITKNPDADQANPASADPAGETPNRRAAQHAAESAPDRVQHQTCRVRHLGREQAVKEEVGRIEDPHLALGQAGEAVTPEVVPERQPARPERPAQHGHQADRELRHVAADRHPPADPDRPEPDQKPDQERPERQGRARSPLFHWCRQTTLLGCPTPSAWRCLGERRDSIDFASRWRENLQSASAILQGPLLGG